MSKNKTKILGLTFVLFCQSALSQSNYKIIDNDIKDKIEYDNSKKTNESERTQIYHLYEINISSLLETKEKMNIIVDEFSKQYGLVESNFDFEMHIWTFTSNYHIPEYWIKEILNKYDYKHSEYTEKYGVL